MAKKKTIIKKKHTTLYVTIAVIVVLAIAAAAFFLLRKGGQGGTVTATGNTSTGSLAATVNGEPITASDIDTAFARLPAMYKQFVTRPQVLEQLIDEKLLLAEAKAQGIKLEAGEVDREILAIKDANKLTQEDFEKALQQQGLTEPEFRDLFEKRLVIQKLFNVSVLENIRVTDADAQKYYDSNKDQFFQPEQVRASHILVNTSTEALDIISQLKKGGNFSDLAVKYSIDPSAKFNQGDLGFFSRGSMVPEFEDAAFKLKVGEVSDPVKTKFGYHVILVTGKKAERQVPFDEVRQRIVDALKSQQGQVVFAQYIQQLKAKNQVAYFGEFVNASSASAEGSPSEESSETPAQQQQESQPTQTQPASQPPTRETGPATTQPPAQETQPSTAGCLKGKGFVLYGASWNKDTQDQLAAFGSDQAALDYVDCAVENDYSAMRQACIDAGIEGFPTWKNGKDIYPGVQTVAKLKQVSGC